MISMISWTATTGLTDPCDTIRERRCDLGWTQAELAERTGVTQADISRIENGLLDPRWSTLERIFSALADPDAEPRRSLANGRKVDTTPEAPTTRWKPKGKTVKIARTR